NSRRIQVAQDALVVEALPGQVPLLEGFQMAHRMLDVQKVCLENQHLNERIKGRPWEREGQDSYNVVRREGEGGSVNVQIGKGNGTEEKKWGVKTGQNGARSWPGNKQVLPRQALAPVE